ncbi:anti-sigma factor antagonist [Streptomyces sp. HNM0645]|uniref:anti-sigma factor antagonist n=1 Tax=Streptomyces sp. HNM0645 TaxID=2782343 RepID=UPI0024B80BCC|nr:anti-sigma factor antagonist [Streptomyces sp. HNM0645]MDI9886424.1 anti-sigma factor antagonist [Streptomyces sp. HNM0645]
MSISWSVEEHRGVAVMAVVGFLGNNAVGRFSDGFGWVVARSTGPVVLDLTGLLGWSAEGVTAVMQAATGLRGGRGPLGLCGLDHLEVADGWADRLGSMTVYPDLDAALDARQPPVG